MTNGITENCLSIEPLACKIVDETFASVLATSVPSDFDTNRREMFFTFFLLIQYNNLCVFYVCISVVVTLKPNFGSDRRNAHTLRNVRKS